MEFCRSIKFRNSGFLVWQYNDIWPCLSWSIVDWYGTPKPSYYFLKRASRPIHISADYESYLWNAGETFKTDIYLLNDTQKPLKGLNYSARLFHCAGGMLAEKTGQAAAGANSSARISGIEYVVPDSMKGKTFFISVELKDSAGYKISDALYPIAVSGTGRLEDYNNIFAELTNIPKAALNVDSPASELMIGKNGTGNINLRISNTADRPVFFVRISSAEESEKLKAIYNDNYISLMPGETKIISVEFMSKDRKELPQQVHFDITGLNCSAQKIMMAVRETGK
jgi:exo-1,4-beta-D-glucosaminidase